MSAADRPRPSGILRGQWDVLLVVAAGGAVGSLGRWAVALALPYRPGGLPWATFVVNVTGCLAIGALMVVVLEVAPPSRYLRPLLGTGLLGGLTTFSTYVLDVRSLAVASRPVPALVYLVGSVIAGLAAVWAGAVLARIAVSARRAPKPTEPPGSPT